MVCRARSPATDPTHGNQPLSHLLSPSAIMSVPQAVVLQTRHRTVPPPVPPLVAEAAFDSKEAYAAYMKNRRVAQERLREFNRPKRVRSRQSAQATSTTQALATVIETLRTRESRTFNNLDADTGSKNYARKKEDWRRRGEAAHERYERMAKKLPKLTSATAVHAAVVQQEAHAGVSLSQVRRAVALTNKRADPDSVARDRGRRRKIKKRLSATRPSAYPAQLARRRETQRVARREQRRPQQEERAVQRARLSAKRKALTSVSEWAYAICNQEWEQAHLYGSDDEWYLRERRIEAGRARRLAREAAADLTADFFANQKCCVRCGELLPLWAPTRLLRCQCSE